MPGERYKFNKEDKEDQVICGALISIGVIAVIQLLGQAQLDTSLKISLYCFAAAIPLLSVALANLIVQYQYEYTIKIWHDGVAVILGVLLSVIGVGAIFWHFSWTIGLTFIVTSIFGLISWVHFEEKLKQINKD